MKTVIEMAREAGLMGNPLAYADWYPEALERFSELVRADAIADEREACAKVADEHMRESEGKSFGVGAAIRARSNT